MGLGFKLAAEVDATEATALEKARIGELGGRVSFLCCAVLAEKRLRKIRMEGVGHVKAHPPPSFHLQHWPFKVTAQPRYLNTF